nr:exodeoxyribonuclease VII small subunit [uncultured Solibaculum sp.]
MSEKKMTFETSMTQLEEIVAQLESGDLPVEQSIQRFEEGLKLLSYCSEVLQKAEQKITVLTEDQDKSPSEKEDA